MFKFQKLSVWIKAKEYGKELFLISNKLPSNYRFSFADQLVRAALSITNNISEGTGRMTIPEQRNFYNMAKGSVYETVNILMVLSDMGLVESEKLNRLIDNADEISKMLSGLINRK